MIINADIKTICINAAEQSLIRQIDLKSKFLCRKRNDYSLTDPIEELIALDKKVQKIIAGRTQAT